MKPKKKRNYIPVLIIFLVLLLVGALAFRFLTPKAPTRAPLVAVYPEPSFLPEKKVMIPSMSFATNVSLPTSANVYSVSEVTSSTQLLPTLANNLQLTPLPQSPNIYTNADKTISLSQIKGQAQVNYSNSNATFDKVVTLTRAERFATDFFSKLSLPYSLDPNTPSHVTYTSESEEETEVPPEQAVVIQLAYALTVDGIPVQNSNVFSSEFVFYVTSQGIGKAVIPSLYFTTTKGVSTPLYNKDDLISLFRQGKISAFQFPASSIQQLTISKATLEYRFDEGQRLLLPFYRLLGNALLVDNTRADVNIGVPAIPLKTQ
ncbi:MAG TPA: hypothetical protein VLH19_01485 [Patescibacteria group bacterium]|nr:hypothetical protein [Patescibacteria group bacterium]